MLDQACEKRYHELQMKYEKLYNHLYDERRDVITGLVESNDERLNSFLIRKHELDDKKYQSMKVEIVHTEDIMLQTYRDKGVKGFWLKAML